MFSSEMYKNESMNSPNTQKCINVGTYLLDSSVNILRELLLSLFTYPSLLNLEALYKSRLRLYKGISSETCTVV